VGSFLHLLKSSLGTGLLAMPAAFKNIGLIPGTIGTFVVAIIATHCVRILVRNLSYTSFYTFKYIHTYYSRFIPERVAEVSQIFLRDTLVLPKLVS
jgi:amino acid permease